MNLKHEIDMASAEVATWPPGLRRSADVSLEGFSTEALQEAAKMLRNRLAAVEAVLALRN